MNDKTEQSLADALRAYQQADADGSRVLVSRQACDEAADTIDTLHAQLAEAQRDAERKVLPTSEAATNEEFAMSKFASAKDRDNALLSTIEMLRNKLDTLRAQLAEAQRELIAKEYERAGMELERNNAQRQHTMQCAINKTDSQRILELTAQLAEAQKDEERLDWMIEQRAYVASDPDCCDGYWLNYQRPDGTVWTQATEHETPRAAIDATKGENNGSN